MADFLRPGDHGLVGGGIGPDGKPDARVAKLPPPTPAPAGVVLLQPAQGGGGGSQTPAASPWFGPPATSNPGWLGTLDPPSGPFWEPPNDYPIPSPYEVPSLEDFARVVKWQDRWRDVIMHIRNVMSGYALPDGTNTIKARRAGLRFAELDALGYGVKYRVIKGWLLLHNAGKQPFGAKVSEATMGLASLSQGYVDREGPGAEAKLEAAITGLGDCSKTWDDVIHLLEPPRSDSSLPEDRDYGAWVDVVAEWMPAGAKLYHDK